MRRVTYSMGVSLDGYIVGPDGGSDWTEPADLELDETRTFSSGVVYLRHRVAR